MKKKRRLRNARLRPVAEKTQLKSTSRETRPRPSLQYWMDDDFRNSEARIEDWLKRGSSPKKTAASDRVKRKERRVKKTPAIVRVKREEEQKVTAEKVGQQSNFGVDQVEEEGEKKEEREKKEEEKKRPPVKTRLERAQQKLEEGYSIFHGIHFKVIDHQKGMALMEEASKEGSITAEGIMHHLGLISKRVSPGKAVRCYRKGVEMGNSFAMVQLGHCYHVGIGVKKSCEQAVRWYKAGVEENNPTAMRCLGSCYQFGHGIEASLTKAVEFYFRAALQGHCVALYSLGYCYEKGVGVTKDLNKALKYLCVSADLGYVFAREDLEMVKLQNRRCTDAKRSILCRSSYLFVFPMLM